MYCSWELTGSGGRHNHLIEDLNGERTVVGQATFAKDKAKLGNNTPGRVTHHRAFAARQARGRSNEMARFGIEPIASTIFVSSTPYPSRSLLQNCTPPLPLSHLITSLSSSTLTKTMIRTLARTARAVREVRQPLQAQAQGVRAFGSSGVMRSDSVFVVSSSAI